MSQIPVVSVVGQSGVGKTTLLEKLIRELKKRGYRIATVKHEAHGSELDRPGKDSWRHAQAGSDVVVLASSERVAMIARTASELSLDEIVARLPIAVDLVITEGYKRADKPKIEVVRPACGGVISPLEELLAIAADEPVPSVTVPRFALDDAAGLAGYLEQALGLTPPGG